MPPPPWKYIVQQLPTDRQVVWIRFGIQPQPPVLAAWSAALTSFFFSVDDVVLTYPAATVTRWRPQ